MELSLVTVSRKTKATQKSKQTFQRHLNLGCQIFSCQNSQVVLDKLKQVNIFPTSHQSPLFFSCYMLLPADISNTSRSEPCCWKSHCLISSLCHVISIPRMILVFQVGEFNFRHGNLAK